MSLNSEKIRELFLQSSSGYAKAETFSIGRSWLSRDIFCSVCGRGDRNVIVIGGFCGKDYNISEFLVKFSHEFDVSESFGKRISEFNISALCGGNRIHFISIVNPDGLTVHNRGIEPDNPFYGRVLKMTNQSSDFSLWNANIRGTQLDGNFNYKWIERKLRERSNGIFANSPSGYFGEYPESELEVSSVCSYCRRIRPDIVVEFRAGESVNIQPFISDNVSDKSKRASKLIYGYTGINIVEDETSFYGSFAGWAASEFSSSSIILNVNKETIEQTPDILKSAILLFCAQ